MIMSEIDGLPNSSPKGRNGGKLKKRMSINPAKAVIGGTSQSASAVKGGISQMVAVVVGGLGGNAHHYYWTRASVKASDALFWNCGNFMQTVIDFFIISVCVFTIVKYCSRKRIDNVKNGDSICAATVNTVTKGMNMNGVA
ncbi:hypothetical protein EDD21DRAFT_353974 [Dissophora ornata]|nr:hypothetical protein EDD21DRAFT_353974 [Dissophora ornata]